MIPYRFPSLERNTMRIPAHHSLTLLCCTAVTLLSVVAIAQPVPTTTPDQVPAENEVEAVTVFEDRLVASEYIILCPEVKNLGTGLLRGYHMLFAGQSEQWQGAVPTLQPIRSDAAVPGLVLQIPQECLPLVEQFETSQGYARQDATIETDQGLLPAYIFVQPGQPEEAEPSAVYTSMMQQMYTALGWYSYSVGAP
jgi:gamma-glutamylcyclotransferase (GGCT)/AIG2-like uncharacterized protein YtfP